MKTSKPRKHTRKPKSTCCKPRIRIPKVSLKKGFKVRPATQRIIKNERPDSDTDA